ncbi:hypothetical protein H257_18989 [Aphanomyces astaci]|uniref:Retrotransposon gag domain-containing protein n=1 Tax=Aphanomyces astaci TaxID=112090 RepID=W4FBL3_APHAT|nr:hypothetical protein H257_18989 [Aphanomyces astaci]ETV64073.1 hypothetical protein H257_18989 [Aphanomyces astaci]|eukprot:XP_009846443.1 hypothetical protein H257_18989 [Aphanomyces astaci]
MVAEATATQQALEEQVTQMSSHGRNREDSLRVPREKIATIEEEATTMSSHESDKLLRWLLQVSTAADAQRISDDATRVAFAMSYLKSRAEDWAFSKRLTDRHCFPSFAVFETELKAIYLPPNSDFRYRSQYYSVLAEGPFDFGLAEFF